MNEKTKRDKFIKKIMTNQKYSITISPRKSLKVIKWIHTLKILEKYYIFIFIFITFFINIIFLKNFYYFICRSLNLINFTIYIYFL